MLLLCTLEDCDKDFVEHLFIEYKKPLYFYLYQILNDEQVAEDALQVAFIRIINNIDKIKAVDLTHRKNYIYKIAKNTAINFYNKNKIEESVTKAYDETVINIVDEKYAAELIAKEGMSENLEICIDCLKDTDKEIISLKYGLDLSDAQIAAHLNISEGAVRKRISRAKVRLAAIIKSKQSEV